MSSKTGIKYLDYRFKADGSRYYFYNPDRKAQLAGVVKAKGFGSDFDSAREYAKQQNVILNQWRKQEQPQTFRSHSWPKGSVGELAQDYMASRWFTKRIRDATREGYKSAIGRFLEFTYQGEKLGRVDARSLRHKHLEEIYEQFLNQYDGKSRATKGGVTTTNYMIRVMKRVYEYGIKREYVTSNPFRKLGLETEQRRTQRWSYDQVMAFVEQAERQGRPSVGLAVLLGYEVGQRVADVLSLTWDQWDGEAFFGEQSKTTNEWWVPVSDELRARLDATSDQTGLLVVNEVTGRAYTKSNFNRIFRDVKANAGLPQDLQMMDLRRTVATELGESGATEDEIMSQTGHKSRQSVRHYINPGRVMAANAAKKRRAYRSDN